LLGLSHGSWWGRVWAGGGKAVPAGGSLAGESGCPVSSMNLHLCSFIVQPLVGCKPVLGCTSLFWLKMDFVLRWFWFAWEAGSELDQVS